MADFELGNNANISYIVTGSLKDKERRAAIYGYIKRSLANCELGYLQEIRRKNIYSLLNKNGTKYEGGSVSACVDKLKIFDDRTIMTVTGGGLFSLSSTYFLGDKNVSVYLDLKDFDLVMNEIRKTSMPRVSCMRRASNVDSGRLSGGANISSPDQGLAKLNADCESKVRELTIRAYKEKEKNGFSEKFFLIQKEIDGMQNSVASAVSERYASPYKTEFSVGDPIDVRFVDVKIDTGVDHKPIRMTVTKARDHSIRKGWENKMIDRKAEFEDTVIPVDIDTDPKRAKSMSIWIDKLQSCSP